MTNKSQTCIGKTSGTPLTENASEREARAGAAHVHKHYGRQPGRYPAQRAGRGIAQLRVRARPRLAFDQGLRSLASGVGLAGFFADTFISG